MKFIGMRTWNKARTAWEFRHEPEHMKVLALIYWRTLLALSALTMLGFVVWGAVLLFNATQDLGSLPAQGGGRAGTLNKEQLRETLEGFEARRARYEALKTAPIQIVDPR